MIEEKFLHFILSFFYLRAVCCFVLWFFFFFFFFFFSRGLICFHFCFFYFLFMLKDSSNRNFFKFDLLCICSIYIMIILTIIYVIHRTNVFIYKAPEEPNKTPQHRKTQKMVYYCYFKQLLP